MEQSKIELLYKILLDKKELTTSNLIRYGITEEEIELMIQKRIIEPITKEEFKLASVEKFRQYGTRLILANYPIEANRCFKICYELEPNGRNIAIQYMLAKIIRKKYDEAFEIFSKIESQHSEKYEKDNNLYLYLLGNITICPKEYQEKIRMLKPQDILLPLGTNTKVENEIRTAIAKHKFKYAYQLINTRYSKERNYSLKFEVIRILVIQAITAETELKATLLDLAKKRNYNQIFSILTKIKQQRYLSDLELAILHITETILNLINYQVIPTSSDIETNDMYDAIKNNDFKLAIEINEEFLNYTKQDSSNNTIHILLTSLNQLVERQLQEYKEFQDQPREILSDKHIYIEEAPTVTTRDDLKDIEDIAYYLSSEKISLDTARKKLGIIQEHLLLIKLIYIRDYYIESNYDMGDMLLREVEQNTSLTPRVTNLLKTIKENKYIYSSKSNVGNKTLVHKP